MKVFISHSGKDKKFVRLLKDCLLENNIETWVDEDQIDLGDRLINKLENAIDDTSHLIIILSPASVESDWVMLELKKALNNQRTGLMQKIIPIKYRECKIPDELTDLLYADLSDEIVLPTDSERVKFISKGFDSFFLKLVRAIKSSAKHINKDEKKEIIESIRSSETDIKKYSSVIHRANYQLIGYASIQAWKKYQNIVALENSTLISNDIRPILLPPSLKQLFTPKIGEKIIVESDLPFGSYGHFAGFRIDDLKITMDKKLRTEIALSAKKYYHVEIDPAKKTVRFVDEIK